MKNLLIIFISSLLMASCTFEKAQPLPVGCTTTIFYATDIQPMINSKCVSCHTAGGTGTGDFTSYTGLKAKAESGSLNTRVFVLKDMPPAGNPQLTEDELSKLKCWIEQGAPNN
ncbi:MAG TPA: cytochrome c [Bacteroidia bacterium]|jgi:uncharacterized membrane protein